VGAAIDRRHWAIIDVRELVSAPLTIPTVERDSALRRLLIAAESGEKAIQRLSGSRHAAIAEWNQWSRVYRSLGSSGATKSPSFDFQG
jgi:hypothetical protein